MKHLILSILTIVFVLPSICQIVEIPDSKFKEALVNYIPKIDTNNDGEIQLSEARVITDLNVSYQRINSMDGIEAFTSLTYLKCDYNNLLYIDITSLSKLKSFSCSGNDLYNLNVTKNTLLFGLNCSDNNISSLDLTKNLMLDNIGCQYNSISSLDFQFNSKLRFIDCSNNSLSSLDVMDLENLTTLKCQYNSNLDVVCISPRHVSDSKDWSKSDYTEWSLKCRQPKPDTLYYNPFNSAPKTDNVLIDIYGFEYFEDSVKTFDGSGLLKVGAYSNSMFIDLSRLSVSDYDSVIIEYNLYTRGRMEKNNLPLPSTSFGTFDKSSTVAVKGNFSLSGSYYRNIDSYELYIDNLRVLGYPSKLITDLAIPIANKQEIIAAYDIYGHQLDIDNLPILTLIILVDSKNKKSKIFYTE